MQVLSSISLLLFDVSIMLNLPIGIYFVITPLVTRCKKRMQFLKMHYVYNLIVTEKSMTRITFFGCIVKLDVCAT